MVEVGTCYFQGFENESDGAWECCYMPCRSYPGPGYGSGQAQGSDGRGFSKRVTAPTRLSCPGLSPGGGLIARSDGERSRGARRLRVQSGQYFTAMLFDN